jgi:hypothetical protein
MPLSWTDPWELPAQWRPAPAREAAPESAFAGQPEGGEKAEPDDRQDQFPDPWPAYGVLRFSPAHGLRVDALGPSGDPFAVPTGASALWGETLDGRPCSLLDVRVNENGTLGAHASRELVGRVFVLGAHVRDLDELEIRRARLRFPGLREFLWHPHLGPIGLPRVGEGPDELVEQTVSVPGGRLTFRLEWEVVKAAHEQRHVRSGEVVVELDEPAILERWMCDWVRPLRDLLVFAMREPSRPEAFVACFDVTVPPPWWKPNRPPTEAVWEVELVRQESVLSQRGPRWRYARLIFSLGELGDEADAVLAKWFDMHRRLEPSAGFLFAALNARLYLENAVLNLTSAAEGYHREFHPSRPLTDERHAELTEAMLAQCATCDERVVYRSAIEHANQRSQRRRLTELYRRAAQAISQRPRAIDAHVAQLVETRNYFVHHDVRAEDVREGDDLSLLLQRLVMVLQVNIMLDLGWPEEGAAGFLRRSYEGQRVLRIADEES